MKMSNRTTGAAAVAGAGLLALTACGGGSTEEQDTQGPSSPAAAESSAMATDHSSGMEGHQHAMQGGPPPEGIEDAADPTFPVGSTVTLTADHMPGMEGSEATITGAFDTTAYSVTYTPTDGGEPVVDHRWVVHEELQDPGEAPLPDGTEVVLEAEHMAGMEGAEATIESSTDETVYMVDVTADGMEMTDHKWVVDSEVEPTE